MSLEHADQIFWYLLLGCVALLIGITSATIGQAIRQESARDLRGTLPLKLAWTLVPAVAALIMFWLCWRYANFPAARQAIYPPGAAVRTGSLLQPLNCFDSPWRAKIMLSTEKVQPRQCQLFLEPMGGAQGRIEADDRRHGPHAG